MLSNWYNVYNYNRNENKEDTIKAKHRIDHWKIILN